MVREEAPGELDYVECLGSHRTSSTNAKDDAVMNLIAQGFLIQVI